MRFLLVPNAFKGTLSSFDAAAAIATGIALELHSATIDRAPLADGGDGSSEVLNISSHARRVEIPAIGAHGEARTAIAWEQGSGALTADVAQIAGLTTITPSSESALKSGSWGIGAVLSWSHLHGYRSITIFPGGSASTDGGAGLAAMLGFEFFDASGSPLDLGPTPSRLLAARLQSVHAIQPPPQPNWPRVTVVTDVRNPLLGPHGAARTFAPQKGADPADIHLLEEALFHLADAVQRSLNIDVASVPGSGAGGGTAFGLMAFCGAELRYGPDYFLDHIHFDEIVARYDYVITGEGRVDQASLTGKLLGGLLARTTSRGIPLVIFCGESTLGPLNLPQGVKLFTLGTRGLTHPTESLVAAAHQFARSLLHGENR